jgi:phage protein D
MLTPRYKLTIGKTTLDSMQQPLIASVVQLVVSFDMDISVDSITLVLGHIGAHVKPVLHDKLTLSLGYEDGVIAQVFTGSVSSIQPNLNTLQVVAYSAGETLFRSYLDETYENRTAGAMVQDLARRAKVAVATSEEGTFFPYYVIDGRRSFARHMRDLGNLCGFDLYFNPQGALVFKKFAASAPAHVFEYRKHILELDARHTPPVAGLVQSWGESPTDQKGYGSSAWLTKNFGHSKGIASSGKPKELLERVALRTNDAAKRAALAEATRIRQQTFQGRLLSMGRPEVKLGDTIRLRAIPDASFNKTFQIRAVTHCLSKREGFTTDVAFRTI